MAYGKGLVGSRATLAAIGAMGVIASPAQSHSPRNLLVVGEPDQFVTKHVSYADLNLVSVPGERTLNRRVGYAVSDLCDQTMGSDRVSFEYLHCSKDAWQQANPQIDRALQRAREIAFTGTSSIAAAAITINISR